MIIFLVKVTANNYWFISYMNSNDNISKVMKKSSVIKATPIPKSHFFSKLKKKFPSHMALILKKKTKQKIKTHIQIKIIVK